jgi:aryl-alcohol dehydrogenase-like predicted oxidoreductase
LAHDAIDTVIVGTRNPRHMQMNVEWVENDLPLASDTIEELHRRFDELGEDWVQKG